MISPFASGHMYGEFLMQYIHTTLYDFAQRDLGLTEIAGSEDNPLVMAMLKLTGDGTFNGWPENDEVPWCSGAMNFWCRYLSLPRSGSLQARSWLGVGRVITLDECKAANDIVILRRGSGDGSKPADFMYDDGTYPPGHVTIFSRCEDDLVWGLGGNQSNRICVAPYPIDRVIGCRRLLG